MKKTKYSKGDNVILSKTIFKNQKPVIIIDLVKMDNDTKYLIKTEKHQTFWTNEDAIVERLRHTSTTQSRKIDKRLAGLKFALDVSSSAKEKKNIQKRIKGLEIALEMAGLNQPAITKKEAIKISEEKHKPIDKIIKGDIKGITIHIRSTAYYDASDPTQTEKGVLYKADIKFNGIQIAHFEDKTEKALKDRVLKFLGSGYLRAKNYGNKGRSKMEKPYLVLWHREDTTFGKSEKKLFFKTEKEAKDFVRIFDELNSFYIKALKDNIPNIIDKPKKTSKKKTRPSPTKSATSVKVGTKEIGNDGNEYIVALRTNGSQYWKKVKN